VAVSTRVNWRDVSRRSRAWVGSEQEWCGLGLHRPVGDAKKEHSGHLGIEVTACVGKRGYRRALAAWPGKIDMNRVVRRAELLV
jgi:hypothetical protein